MQWHDCVLQAVELRMVQGAVSGFPPVVQTIVERLSALPQVRAMALAGSQVTAVADQRSDFDVYVYHDVEVPVMLRAKLAAEFAECMDIDSRFWGPSDEWIVAATGTKIDLIYFEADWITAQLEHVLIRHQASVGYSTCFWHTIRHSQPLFDRDGWLAALQSVAAQPYPELLRRAIIANNYPILRHTLSSLAYQIESAFARNDMISVQHRATALLASYFDILFAVNRLPHPGEKRLLAWIKTHCSTLPAQIEPQLHAILSVQLAQENRVLLLDQLDVLLLAEGLIEREGQTGQRPWEQKHDDAPSA
jgi:hypothetical protein